MAGENIRKTSSPEGNSVDVRAALYFSWFFFTGSQREARILWHVENDPDYHILFASGTTTNLTAPAYTFPSGKTIIWSIVGTDSHGDGQISEEYTFSTASAAVSPTSYPSGSNVNTGEAISFLWDISGSLGSYTQQSAVFHWKVSTAGSYTVVSISGNTKRATIAANTFPTGKTIEWYVTATDSSGVTTSSSVKSFNTASGTITNVTYPSGNAVNYGQVLRFTWDFIGPSGSYAQSSAALYWRASTSDPWSSIAASGSNKYLNVPAYTFPSNATISWYLSGTDSGGTSSTTSVLTFKTASPKITPQSSPTSGYADPRNAISFSWYFTDGTNAYDQQSASLKWRVSGQSNWTTVAASGATQNVTVAANTFPTLSTIEWMLTGTVRGGTSSETEVYSFSTTASTANAVCLSPVGRSENGSKDITLLWTVRNEDGSLPSRVVVKWKQSTAAATAWTTLLDTTDPDMSYTVTAGTFPAGGIDWQVAAYNRDSVAGPTSLASFVCIVAPAAPVGLMATAVPRTLISWQSSGQEAYEIEIDGEVVQTAYGPSVTNWQVKEPLENGVHTIRVRVQGSYELWSDWSEAGVSIENVPAGAITPAGKFRTDAALSWTYSGAADPEIIAIYRDGVWIGTATGKTAFTDRFVLGEHAWRIEYWYADGNYTRSIDVIGVLKVPTLMIVPKAGGEWMQLPYSAKSDRNIGFLWTQQNAQFHVTGSKWPVLETAPYETLSADYDCAFKDPVCVRKFEQLRGQIVILKSRDGSVVIGGLVQMKKTVTEFYTTFSFSVQMNHWEDFVNDD